MLPLLSGTRGTAPRPLMLFVILIGAALMPVSTRAATPVASSISLETYARRCVDPSCDLVAEEITAIDTDSQLSTLAPLQAFADAVAFDPAEQAGADATLAMTASWTSVSSGNLGFSGDVGIRRPTASVAGGCQASNDRSDGFSYTFVSSTDGELTVDSAIECMPLEFTTATGSVSVLLDGSVRSVESVTASNPSASGSVTVPITLGTTHTLEIRPNLNGVGGNSCGPPPGWAWSCTGSASWSFDVAAPVPSVGSAPGGFATVAICAWAAAAIAMARRRIAR